MHTPPPRVSHVEEEALWARWVRRSWWCGSNMGRSDMGEDAFPARWLRE